MSVLFDKMGSRIFIFGCENYDFGRTFMLKNTKLTDVIKQVLFFFQEKCLDNIFYFKFYMLNFKLQIIFLLLYGAN